METGPGPPSSLAGSLRGHGRPWSPRRGSVFPEGMGGPAFASKGRARPLQGQATLRTRRWEPRFTETPTRVNTSPSGAPW